MHNSGAPRRGIEKVRRCHCERTRPRQSILRVARSKLHQPLSSRL